MSDLTDAQWRSVEAASATVEWAGSPVRVIALETLRTIIRKSRRSNDQNALLWALYEDVLKQGGETLGGWTRDDLHEWLLGTHFGWDKTEALGMKRIRPKRRSSRLTKMEFSELIETLVREMAQHGIILELPEDATKS